MLGEYRELKPPFDVDKRTDMQMKWRNKYTYANLYVMVYSTANLSCEFRQ